LTLCGLHGVIFQKMVLFRVGKVYIHLEKRMEERFVTEQPGNRQKIFKPELYFALFE
jgi:hypothetical protein